MLDEFVAGWATVLQLWRAEKNMSCSKADLHWFVGILDRWFENLLMPSIFKCLPKAPTNANPPKQVDKLAQKEEKRGRYRDTAVQRLQSLEGEGGAMVYTDWSSKTVRG